MNKSISDRVLVTPSHYAKTHFLYVQETGILKSMEPHISQRKNLDSFLLLFVLSGQGTLICQEHTWSLHQGDCAWIDCQYLYSHESSQDSPWELKWVHFHGNGAREFYEYYLSLTLSPVFSPENPAIFNASLSELLELEKRNDPWKELLSHKHLTDLITACFCENGKKKNIQNSGLEKLRQIREYLFQNYQEAISLENLSTRFFISKYHLVREYKKHFGVTPGNELINLRISQAKKLLRFENQSVQEISIHCGFHDTAYFIRAFKKSENMTPLEYRRKW